MTSMQDPEAPNANPRDADILLAEGFRILDFGGGTYIGHVIEEQDSSTPSLSDGAIGHIDDTINNNINPNDHNNNHNSNSGGGAGRVLPHGFGYLVLPDLSQHSGEFRHGRAGGPGVLIRPDGSEREGSWRHNRRAGEFRLTRADVVPR